MRHEIAGSAAYTIQEAAKLTGASASVLRIWELRYGWPSPERQPNGYRLYTRAQVEQIARVVAYIDSGLSIGELIVDGFPRFPTRGRQAPDFSALHERRPSLRATSESRRLLLIGAIRTRAYGHVDMLLAECACLVHPDDRDETGWIPALIGLAAWDAVSYPLPTASKVRAYIRSQVGDAAYAALVDRAAIRQPNPGR